ncbi:MAG: DDE transposase family protein [Synechococcales cyanobacterium RM1_1_8]|nr:DDE transposase family protein [Synechococcales cyanobacterium RM1_1_8]
MGEPSNCWYVVAQDQGGCLVLSAQALVAQAVEQDEAGEAPTVECWGPFESELAAIAKRIGLIRAGKCKPQ